MYSPVSTGDSGSIRNRRCSREKSERLRRMDNAPAAIVNGMVMFRLAVSRDRDRRGRHRRQARVTAEGQRDHDVHGLRTARRRRVRHDDVDGDACLTSDVRVVAVGRVDRDRRDRRAPPSP